MPVLRLGFRPLYWGAAVFAALAIPLWAGLYLGGPIMQPRALPEYLWHAHEMVFGFGLAVVVGFLFTAVRNWTGIDTPRGTPLALLALLWALARVLMWSGPTLAAAACSAGFILLAGLAVGRVLWQARNRRNYFVAALLLGFAALDAAFFGAVSGVVAVAPLAIVRTSILLLVFLVTVIGGRVIPMFTQNATGVKIARIAVVDRGALAALLAAIAMQGLSLPGPIVSACWFLAAAAHAVRLATWRPWVSRGRPILWVLHVAYAWIPIGLFLEGLSQLQLFSAILALHALTIGAIGGMISGMITRTALGHTGRTLEAGSAEVVFYTFILLAALARVAGPVVAPALYPLWLATSAAFWSAGFIAYLSRYTPILWRPRIDGSPG